MKNFVTYQDNGCIINVGTCLDSDFQFQKGYPSHILETIDLVPLDVFYIQDNELIKIPDSPGIGYIFNYDLKQWVADPNSMSLEIKMQRDQLLYQSDWTQIPNNPLTSEKQQEWAVYRQQLRDITSQSGYPFNVVWPTQPE